MDKFFCGMAFILFNLYQAGSGFRDTVHGTEVNGTDKNSYVMI